MNVSVTSLGDDRFSVTGELTFETVPQLFKRTPEYFRGAANSLTVDLAQVTRSDSAGLALLLEWMRVTKARGGKISFINLPEQLLALATVSGLEKILPASLSA